MSSGETNQGPKKGVEEKERAGPDEKRPAPDEKRREQEEAIDEALDETFPASDPIAPSIIQDRRR